MKIVLAPDSYKEGLSAAQICSALKTGLRRVVPHAHILSFPMADGGEGTLDALTRSSKSIQTLRVQGPLGEHVQARIGFLDKGQTAVVEMAQASGLNHVPPNRRNPMLTHSYGTGQLIRAALDKGVEKIILTLGGVATNDAGVGMAKALGYRFLNKSSIEISNGAQGLLELHHIECNQIHPRLKQTRFLVACDVANPLLGPKGSARVYGPQKGATPAMVLQIEKALERFSDVVKKDLGIPVKHFPGAGAAGGTGAGAKAFLKARFTTGIQMVMETIQLESHLKDADWVITGEGKLDSQTAYGKTLAGIARLAKKHQIPLLAICGQVAAGADKLHGLGITAYVSIAPGPMTYKTSMQQAPGLLQNQIAEMARIFLSGRSSRLLKKPIH